MLELVLEVFLYTIPETTGHALVYVLTFGQVKCDETTAIVLGVLFWIVLIVLLGVWIR